jgi:serine/threonine-protein kinase
MKDIGKYRLVAEIGHGGMADVYLALAPGPNGFNKMVVVKELREASHDESTLAMFLDEARIAARLNHPNIAQIYEVGYHGTGQPFLALEFVDGQSLQAVLRRAKRDVPRPVLLRVVSDVLSALDYAHGLADFDGAPLQIVHRDVSPHNVIVSYDGFGKLVDFGIAKASLRNVVTQAGVLKGKVAFMSPEQAAGRPVDARSDLFSVGVMFYQAVTGRRLWGTSQDMAILVRLAGGHLPELDESLAEVPEALAAIVRKALAPNPDDRYESAAEFQADLERYGQIGQGLASRREVGAYIASLFAAERASLREVLDQRARESRDPSEESSLPRLQFLSGGTISTESSSSGSVPKTSLTGALLPGGSMAPPSRGGALRRGASVAALLALGFSAAYFLRAGASKSGPSAPGAAASVSPLAPSLASAGPPTTVVTPPGSNPTAASAPASVRLTVEARPPQARLSINDRALPTNPATVTVAANTEQQVRAEAEGFAVSLQSITPGRDESLVLQLLPAARGRPSPPARGAAAKAAPAAPAPPRDPATSSTTKAAADAAGF